VAGEPWQAAGLGLQGPATPAPRPRLIPPRRQTPPRSPPRAPQEKARAESLPPDAIDDLWERREPALALERGQRQRRAPGWMQGETYVGRLPGGASRAGGGGGGGAPAGDDDDEAANSSDQGGGSARRPRKRGGSNSAANSGGSAGPAPPRGTALAAQQALAAAAAAAAGAAGLQRARSGLSNASGGAVQLHQAIAAALAQPGVPHMIEWRTDEGRQSMEVALVLGGQVFVGCLASRGPLLNWLPPGAAAAAGQGGGAAAPAAAPAPAPAPRAAAAPVVKEEPAAAAAPAFERANSSDARERRCALCAGAGDAGLGPFMPVQIQNGHLDWVHRDCALWSPEVSVDATGRLVGGRSGLRRGGAGAERAGNLRPAHHGHQGALAGTPPQPPRRLTTRHSPTQTHPTGQPRRRGAPRPRDGVLAVRPPRRDAVVLGPQHVRLRAAPAVRPQDGLPPRGACPRGPVLGLAWAMLACAARARLAGPRRLTPPPSPPPARRTPTTRASTAAASSRALRTTPPRRALTPPRCAPRSPRATPRSLPTGVAAPAAAAPRRWRPPSF
jgi:hypothetical protein